MQAFEGIGNLGKDPVIRYAASGTAVCQVSCAYTTKRSTDAEETLWVQLKFFKKAAEIVNQYAKKGTQMWVRGRLELSEWDDKSGVHQKMLCCLVDQFQLLGGKDGERPAAAPAQQAPAADEYDDDIPF